MDLQSELARERRARLAAERLLSLRQHELHNANEQLGKHANALTEEIVEKREEAIDLRDQTDQALQNLELAQSEVHIAKRRLWDSIETIEDGFAVFDSDNKMVIANSSYLSVFDGLTFVQPGISYDELALLMIEEGIVNLEGLPPMDWMDQMLDRWRETQPPTRRIELWNGVHVKLVDRRSEAGDTVSLALNITDTIRYERKLKKASQRAQAANRAKSVFLARMSHELRTPMNGVLGMAELLGDTAINEEQELYVDTIKTSSEALLLLINDVLDFSKLEAAKLTLSMGQFDLEQLILDLSRLFQTSLHEKDVDLIVDYDLFLPTEFVGDAGRIRQVLTNLIGNAIKFTEIGHVEVGVTGVPSDDGVQLHLTIKDSGIGIAEDMIGHIFGEFNQVEDEKNRKFEGTGLGLAITKQLVNLMSGEIWVTSIPDEGSVFGVKLPVTLAKDIPLAPPRAPKWITKVCDVTPESKTSHAIGSQLVKLGLAVQFAELGKVTDFAANVLVLVDADGQEAAKLSDALQGRNTAQWPRILAFSDRATPVSVAGQSVETLQKPVGRAALMEALGRLDPPQALILEAPMAPTPEEPDVAIPTSDKTPEPQTDQASEAEVPQATGAPRKMRVLAAEDNKTNRLVMEKMLKTLNIELRFAENGQIAVETWEEMRPDLILMDISMPIMDGKEATKSIRSKAAELGLPHTPIVAVTAHAVDGDEEQILAAGLDHYLTKPLKKQQIFDRIRVAMPDEVEPVFPDETSAVEDGAVDLQPVDEQQKQVAQNQGAASENQTNADEMGLEGLNPSVLPQTRADQIRRLSEALGTNPVATPEQTRPVSQELGHAQDLWKGLGEAPKMEQTAKS